MAGGFAEGYLGVKDYNKLFLDHISVARMSRDDFVSEVRRVFVEEGSDQVIGGPSPLRSIRALFSKSVCYYSKVNKCFLLYSSYEWCS